jgi:hypothetical protein
MDGVGEIVEGGVGESHGAHHYRCNRRIFLPWNPIKIILNKKTIDFVEIARRTRKGEGRHVVLERMGYGPWERFPETKSSKPERIVYKVNY